MRVFTSNPESIKLLPTSDTTVTGMMRSGGETRRSVQWDIEDAMRNVAFLRGSMTAIANNLIAPGFTFSKVKEHEKEATDEALLQLKRFYGVGQPKDYKNFKAFYTTSGKLYATAIAISAFGAASWEVVGDSLFGYPIGFEFIPGFVEPQIEKNGNFRKPAFVQYLSTTGFDRVEWNDPSKIIYFTRPDFGGLPFSSDLEALVNYTLPSDIYAALSWLSLHKNRNSPLDGYWLMDPGASQEAFDKFSQFLKGRYTGGGNYAKAPILAKGLIEFKPMRRADEEMPYSEGRDWARQEMAGVTHVPGSKLGVTRDLSMANSREAKKDYYETVIEPLQQTIEETTYEQAHVRLLGIRGWKLKFNNPAFVNEVEQASIDRTYWNMGVRSANEIRVRDGQEPRDGGDEYFEPTNMLPAEQGSRYRDPGEEEGNPSEEDPTGQKPRPVRADEQAMYDEIKKWRTVAIKQAKGEKKPKKFECNFISPALQFRIEDAVEDANGDIELIKYAFELAAKAVKEMFDNGQ